MKNTFRKLLIISGKMPAARTARMSIFGLWRLNSFLTTAANLPAIKRLLQAANPALPKSPAALRNLPVLQNLPQAQKNLPSNFELIDFQQKTPHPAEFFLYIFLCQNNPARHVFFSFFAQYGIHYFNQAESTLLKHFFKVFF